MNGIIIIALQGRLIKRQPWNAGLLDLLDAIFPQSPNRQGYMPGPIPPPELQGVFISEGLAAAQRRNLL